jgi:hypothetical protein
MGKGSKYHRKGVDIRSVAGGYIMEREVKITCIGGSKYHGYGVLYTMDKGFDIPLIRGLT